MKITQPMTQSAEEPLRIRAVACCCHSIEEPLVFSVGQLRHAVPVAQAIAPFQPVVVESAGPFSDIRGLMPKCHACRLRGDMPEPIYPLA